MSTFETLVGNPTQMVSVIHNTEASARTRMIKAISNLQEFGAMFNARLRMECTSAIEQIKNTNIKLLPIGEVRQWEVNEDYSDVTLRVAVRRTS